MKGFRNRRGRGTACHQPNPQAASLTVPSASPRTWRRAHLSSRTEIWEGGREGVLTPGASWASVPGCQTDSQRPLGNQDEGARGAPSQLRFWLLGIAGGANTEKW